MGVWGQSPHLLNPFPKSGRSVRHLALFFENFHSQADNSRKSFIRLLRILKKERIKSWEFRKMAGSVAENFKKSADRFLGIPENGRHSPEPVLANPRMIITNSVGGFANPAPVKEKDRLSC
jgi:hypothetical protein